MPRDRRREAISPGSSPGGPNPPNVERDAPAILESTPGRPLKLPAPSQPEPELLGSTGSCGMLVGSCDKPNLPASSTGRLDHAFVVERMLPYPFIVRCSVVSVT